MWSRNRLAIGPEALERRMAEQKAKAADGKPQRKGLMGWMSEKAEAAQAAAARFCSSTFIIPLFDCR